MTDGRVKLLFKPSDRFSLLLGPRTEEQDDRRFHDPAHHSGQRSGPSRPNARSLSPGHNKFHQFWAEVNWDWASAN